MFADVSEEPGGNLGSYYLLGHEVMQIFADVSEEPGGNLRR